MKALDELNFEQAYAELETIITQMDSGQLPLEDSVTLFERGRALAAYCQRLLDDAELRVSKLMDDGEIAPL